MDDAAAGANTVVADAIQWPLTALDRMSAVPALVQGETQGRPMYDSTLIGARAWEATSAGAQPEVLPRWHDVNDDDSRPMSPPLTLPSWHCTPSATGPHTPERHWGTW